MTAVSNAMKRKYDQSLTRSARVPETIEVVDATKTIWKSHWDIAACPCATTRGAAAPSPASSARSATVGPENGSNVPNQPPSSTPTYIQP